MNCPPFRGDPALAGGGYMITWLDSSNAGEGLVYYDSKLPTMTFVSFF
jgi:hypothetical protein